MEAVNVKQQQTKKPSKEILAKGFVAGYMASNAVANSSRLVSPMLFEEMENCSKTLTRDQYVAVENAAHTALEQTGLKAKGVEIIKAAAESRDVVKKLMEQECEKGFVKFLPKSAKQRIARRNATMLQSGKNACYATAGNKVVVPGKGLELSAFHEIGHAMNANLSKFGKMLQKCRCASVLAIPIAIIALTTSKKSKDEQPKNKIDKAATFIKNNAGKLTFAAFLPMLLEEGLATIKGNKLARKLLSPDVAKRVARCNALGFASYGLLATLSGVGIYYGNKIRDSFVEKNSKSSLNTTQV